jgi:hypothetical protein
MSADPLWQAFPDEYIAVVKTLPAKKQSLINQKITSID